MSFFSQIDLMPEDPILSIPLLFQADAHPQKVNLGIGAYRDDQGKPIILQAVKKAEKLLYEEEKNKEYQTIDGNAKYQEEALKLLFGRLPIAVASIQTLGGSGALRIIADFLMRTLKEKTVYIPSPTWPNHTLIFKSAGLRAVNYEYLDSTGLAVNFKSILALCHTLPQETAIVIQGSCHNPTGLDLTHQEWEELIPILKEKKIYPILDIAYQGFGVSLEEDVYAARRMLDLGVEFAVCYSFSKNMGLYGERIGLLAVVTDHPETATKITSHLKQIVRSQYSSPPLHSAQIVRIVLSNPELRKEWENELSQMQKRVREMRKCLAVGLKNSKRNFDFLEKQSGIFSYTGLTPEEVQRLRSQFGVYLVSSGRMNVAGLTTETVKIVADAISQIL